MLKKNNMRKCILTNEIKSKDELIRIVRLKDGTFEVNSEAKGRGAYVSRDPELVEKLLKHKVLHKTFKTVVSNKVYEELVTKIKGG